MQKHFKLSRIAASVAVAITSLAGTQAIAGPGFTDVTLQGGTTGRIQTYFAYSPSGQRVNPVVEDTAIANAEGRVPNFTGKALRKFIDPLPLPGSAATAATMADGVTKKYLQIGVPSFWTRPDGTVSTDKYYEIGLVEFTDRYHSDLKKETTLRGYVQIDHLASNNRGALPGSIALPLTYPDGSPILIAGTDTTGKLTGFKVQAKAVDKPRFLGPILIAIKDEPTRMKFHNLLPTGRAQLGAPDANGKPVVVKRNGDIFLPVDKTILGAGLGPDGLTEYTQNRADIHLHGGDTPWISDGTPHQWITPIDEADPANPLSLANAFNNPANGLDPAYLKNYLRGDSAANVPDMYDPGPGAVTYFWPNGQSSRFLWYHDHTFGATRTNVYAGMFAGYPLLDNTAIQLATDGVIPQVGSDHYVPMVIQDRTFVPDDIALQDAAWNTSAWGQPGDLWFPHVYETVQDPAQINNWNAVGRWHYGPWFWPVFPSLYPLPTGEYSPTGAENTVTTTPEAWQDTAIVNGVAYPTLDVDPGVYRFLFLNGTNDRMVNISLFEAKQDATLSDGTVVHSPVGLTEIDMVPAGVPAVPCAPGVKRPVVTAGVTCTPDTWPTDNRAGGVPDPKGAGPSIYQFASEGGWLPKVVKHEPTPINYLQDKGRITVLNVELGRSGLFLSPAERADTLIDFSQYAGKTLLVYNDSGAPVPAGDPRNDLFTGVGDQSGSGGAEDTLPGYGPNTRTVMQIKVRATPKAGGAVPAAFNPATLETRIPQAYFATQDKPTVAQAAYGSTTTTNGTVVPGFDANWNNLTVAQSTATIYAGSVKEPIFNFVPGTPNNGINAVTVTSGGHGYLTAPAVTITPPAIVKAGDKAATAAATMKIDKISVTNGGTGYTQAPVVTIVGGGGNGATATATIDRTVGSATRGQVTAVTLTNPDPTSPLAAGGGGYTDLTQTTITFTGGGGTGAAAAASGKVFDISLTSPGVGYAVGEVASVTVGASPALPFAAANNATAVPTAPAGGLARANYLVKNKTIQELFDPTYGRLNATFGVELPFTSATTQTTIPLGYVDDTTENFSDGETQIWKIVHNGVDSHPVHFHLLNVQIINRVGWDGFVTLPEPNETGWKETIKMSPLEDVIVAVKAAKPKLPGFGLPLSNRLADPTQPEGSPFGFTQIDPTTGFPKTVVNTMNNYGWEYVWHCHILGHEENDFMRPVKFEANEATPAAPTWAAVTPAAASAAGVDLSWNDNSQTEYKFDVLRADVLSTGAYGPFASVGAGLANYGKFLDTTAVGTNSLGGTKVAYQIVAVGGYGSAASPILVVDLPAAAPAAPTGLTAIGQSGSNILLNWTDVATNETSYSLVRTIGATATTLPALAANSVTFNDTGLPVDTLVQYQLTAVNASGASTPVATVSASTLGAPALVGLTATANTSTQVTLTWTAPLLRAQSVTSYNIVRSGGAGPVTFTKASGIPGFVDTTAAQNTAYTYTVNAVNASGAAPAVNGPTSTASVTTSVAAAGTLNSLTAVAPSTNLVNVGWTGGVPATSYLLERCTFSAANLNCTAASAIWLPAVTVAAPASGYADSSVVANTSYSYRLTATNVVATNKSNTLTTTVKTPAASTVVAAPINLTAVVSFAPARIQLTWTDTAVNETAFIIERSTDGVNFAQVGTALPRNGSPATAGTAGQTRTFSDAAVASGQTYTYRVYAQNVTGAVVTNSAALTTAPIFYGLVAPVLNTAAIASPTRITLSWTDLSSAEAGFAVWRSDNGAAAVQIGTVNRTAAQSTSTNVAVTFNNNNGAATPLVLGHTYSYYVTALNGTVVSLPSNTVGVLFAAPAVPAPLTAAAARNAAGTRSTVTLTLPAAPAGVTYTVLRVTPAGLPGAGTATVLNNTTVSTFTDTNLRRSATPYIYQIRANGAAGSSAYATTSVLVN